MDRRVFVATLLLTLLGSAFAQEPPAPDASDLVILLDVSSSMRRRDAFDRARRLIDGLADEAVRPGAHVALVPFGTGVHEVQRFDAPADEAGTAEARARLRTALAEIRTRDSYSYLGEALDTGLRLLAEFKASDPRRTRHLVLISDGLQSVASRDTPLSLPDVLARWAGQGLRAPDDYVVWYAYIRKSEPDLVSAIERTGAGRVAAIDRLEGLKWTFTRIETGTADLGAKRTGSWTARVPFVATSREGAAGHRLKLSIVGDLPAGMTLDVQPPELALIGSRTEVDVRISCTGARRGVHEDIAIVVEGDGALHWVEPHRVPLRVYVGEPRLEVKRTRIDLGTLRPGAEATGVIAFVPNEDAAAADPSPRFGIVRLPKGVHIEGASVRPEPGELALGFRVKVPAEAEDGTAECRLKVDAGDIDLSAREVTVVYRVELPRVEARGTVALEAAAGGDVAGELPLVPDADARRIAPEVGGVVKGHGLPDGVTVEVKPVVVRGQTALPLRVRVNGDVEPGEYRDSLALVAPGVKVEPSHVEFALTVVKAPEPPALELPASVELGEVPASHAGELEGRFAVELPPENPGTEIVLESSTGRIVSGRVPLAEGANEVTFRLQPEETEAGEHVEFLRVLVQRAGISREAGMIALHWRVTESRIAVTEVKKPAPVVMHGGKTDLEVTIDASADLRGKYLGVRLAFDGAPEGMTVTTTTAEVELLGGQQTVPVPLEVKGARPGSHRGRLELTQETGIVLATAPFRMVVDRLPVAAAIDGDLEGLAPGADRSVTLLFTVPMVPPEPVDVTVQVERQGLPEDVTLHTVETVTLRRAGEVRIPVKFRVGDGAEAGTYSPRVVLSAGDAVALSPSSFELTAVVPRAEQKVAAAAPTTSDGGRGYWAGLGAVALVLTAGAALFLGRSKEDMLLVNG